MPPFTRSETMYSDESYDNDVSDISFTSYTESGEEVESEASNVQRKQAIQPPPDLDVNRAALFFMNAKSRTPSVVTLFQGKAPGQLDFLLHGVEGETHSRSPLSPSGSTPATVFTKDARFRSRAKRGEDQPSRGIDSDDTFRRIVLTKAISHHRPQIS
ncbi:hypothetical protein BKA70DRAFT_1416067 [Coprinopsis sp. MPI-PUGE-AT-0042]|nr:hypothetical protein BKA70DRAFT_1416067 [Coprinopsis sp. MPI-PUGE-AT-0042]